MDKQLKELLKADQLCNEILYVQSTGEQIKLSTQLRLVEESEWAIYYFVGPHPKAKLLHKMKWGNG